MATTPSTLTAAAPAMSTQQVGGRSVSGNMASLAASSAVFSKLRKPNRETDRYQIAQRWQIEAYRHTNICGEARYAATLFAALAARAEIGIADPQSLRNKATWITSGPEVEALNEIAPDVRSRTKLIRDYMLHRVVAGECYLIARERMDTDPGYEPPPIDPRTGDEFLDWETWREFQARNADLLDPDYDPHLYPAGNPNVENPIWEIVAVTELRLTGDVWSLRHDNDIYVNLKPDDPVIRMWCPDPANRREAWSPFRSLIPTLREIEWLTGHIFTQIRSRLMSAGVWFLPENMTFPPPPPEMVEGGTDAIAAMNEAEQFMISLAASGSYELDMDEVSFPTVVMADAAALAEVDQNKLIKFWSEIDVAAMTLRSDAVRRFALGMDLPPEQVIGSSGIAVTGSQGSAGSVNHWGVWANEEQTIVAHIEPALDDFADVITTAYIRLAVPDSTVVVAYDTSSLRLRQDRSKEAIELYDRGVLKAKVLMREVGFDPDNDIQDEDEHRLWLLNKIVAGQFQPDQMAVALALLTKGTDAVELGSGEPGDEAETDPTERAGRDEPPSLEDHPYEGPPREQHDHSPAPFSVVGASCEAVVLRALEKAGNRLVNDGKRGRDKDRSIPFHLAHVSLSPNKTWTSADFDLSMGDLLLADVPAGQRAALTHQMGAFCASLYNESEGYTREGLLTAVKGL